MKIKKVDNVILFKRLSYLFAFSLFVDVLFGWFAETAEERIVWAIGGFIALGLATLCIALSLMSKALKDKSPSYRNGGG